MNSLLNYETARVLNFVIGDQLFKDTEYVFEYPTGLLLKRNEAQPNTFYINCPNGADILNAIPHSIENRDSCLCVNKYNASWRVFYEVNTGAPTREKRMSASYCGNNLAESLAKLWINTGSVDVTIYDETIVLLDLVFYTYEGSSVKEIIDNTVVFTYQSEIRTLHKLSLAKQAKLKFMSLKEEVAV